MAVSALRGRLTPQGVNQADIVQAIENLNSIVNALYPAANLSLQGGVLPVLPASTVACGSALTLTTSHSRRLVLLDTATGSVATLPSATGSGNVYAFLVTVTATSNSHVIKVGNASDEMRGYVIQDSDTATAPNTWWAADNDDTITLNRTTSGLAAQGEYFELVDGATNHYFVRGYSQANGTEITPFSATV